MFEMGLGLLLIAFGVFTLIGGVALWIATRMFGEEGKLMAMMISYIVASVIWWVVPFGGILSLILLVFLIKQFTTAEIGTAIGIVFIADIIAFGAVALIILVILGETLLFF